jgi:diguanylate cyclase (GGDEF)-like protein
LAIRAGARNRVRHENGSPNPVNASIYRLSEGKPVRLISRNDTSLVAALVIGAVVLFQQPLRFVFDAAEEIERQYHLDLTQGLGVLAVVFVFHMYRKRVEAKTEAAAAAIETQQARLRSQELEQLVGLSRALASVTDFAGLSQVFSRYLPTFAREQAISLLISRQGCWDVLLRDEGEHRTVEQLETVADRALVEEVGRDAHRENLRVGDVLCFPLMIGVRPVGIIQVHDVPALSPGDCRALEAAASMAAIAIRNVQSMIETRENSVRDGLTGCFNRAHALETLNAELRRARRGKIPLSLVMFDIDDFKRVNDSYGHATGDHMLTEVGRRLAEVLRTSDLKCRYGGDEFLVILPDTPAAGARHVAESIRNAMSHIALTIGDANVAVTVSVGVATSEGEERDAQFFVALVDKALYRAKQTGRDRVCDTDVRAATPLRLAGNA